ncbi:unnamed protein product, partial [marine sediment metagenome]
ENRMTPQEQEKLFKKVRRRFRRWSERKCSGYVHGVVDEARRKTANPEMVKYRNEAYCCGYLCGFIDARGFDAASRYKYIIRPIGYYRWWADAK